MANMRAKGVVQLIVCMPKELRDAAKAKAEARGEPLAEVVRRMLREWVDR